MLRMHKDHVFIRRSILEFRQPHPEASQATMLRAFQQLQQSTRRWPVLSPLARTARTRAASWIQPSGYWESVHLRLLFTTAFACLTAEPSPAPPATWRRVPGPSGQLSTSTLCRGKKAPKNEAGVVVPVHARRGGGVRLPGQGRGSVRLAFCDAENNLTKYTLDMTQSSNDRVIRGLQHPRVVVQRENCHAALRFVAMAQRSDGPAAPP